MMHHDKRTNTLGITAVEPTVLSRDFDCLIDLRSTKYEHWTYNQGMVCQVLEVRAARPTRIRTTRALSDLLQRIGVTADARIEWPYNLGGRFTGLLMREVLAVVEIVLAAVFARRILVLHAHPLGLFLASPFLCVLGKRFTICLHNDFVTTLRENGHEQTIERWLWWCVSRLNRRLIFAAPNKYFARYIRKFLPPKSTVVIWPHPVTPRAVYEKVASSVPDSLPAQIYAGFFGRVETGRGISAFEGQVKRHPERSYIVAGMGASRFPRYANVYCYERPPTDVYCALVTRSDSLFIDLRSDVYRIGESGVYWDAVGLDVAVLYGEVPRMYRARLRQHFGHRSIKLHPGE